MIFSKAYWNERYAKHQDSWDIGEISTPLREYFKQLEDKEQKILIPGCGNAYEALYLHNQGFSQIYILDYSAFVINLFKEQHPCFPRKHILCEDFFEHKGEYDLIIEQTFFCALDPGQRPAYAEQMYRLLRPEGKLTGLLFDRDFSVNPPFGGSKAEYLQYFQPYFNIRKMEECYNSIEPRKGSELFMILEKRINPVLQPAGPNP